MNEPQRPDLNGMRSAYPAGLGPVEALKLALEKEVETCNIYKKFSIESKMLEVRDIFMFLSDEERKHQRLIENKIKELTKY